MNSAIYTVNLLAMQANKLETALRERTQSPNLYDFLSFLCVYGMLEAWATIVYYASTNQSTHDFVDEYTHATQDYNGAVIAMHLANVLIFAYTAAVITLLSLPRIVQNVASTGQTYMNSWRSNRSVRIQEIDEESLHESAHDNLPLIRDI